MPHQRTRAPHHHASAQPHTLITDPPPPQNGLYLPRGDKTEAANVSALVACVGPTYVDAQGQKLPIESMLPYIADAETGHSNLFSLAASLGSGYLVYKALKTGSMGDIKNVLETRSQRDAAIEAKAKGSSDADFLDSLRGGGNGGGGSGSGSGSG